MMPVQRTGRRSVATHYAPGPMVRPSRPAVSVVVPFHGSREQAGALLDALDGLELGTDDEVLVVDNTGAGAVPCDGRAEVLAADRERSAYYARNVGAARARGEWLLFMDADCRPRPEIVDRYLATVPAPRTGAVVGEVEAEPGQDSLVARYARSRGHLAQHHHWRHPFRPWGITANLLVRRAAWASVGGFQEGVRSAGDTEFSWRLQDAGWQLEYRPEAVVAHRHRETVARLARQSARYGAGRAWVARRYPGAMAEPRLLAPVARSAAGVVIWTATGRFERAAFKALDAVYVTARWGAYRLSNTPPGKRGIPALADAALIAGAFPSLDAPSAVTAARELGPGARVEAASRPVRVDLDAARALEIAWAEDDGALRRAGAAAWLLVHEPRRVLAHALRRGRPSLLDLAPRGRRLREAGVGVLLCAGPEAEADAGALAALLGLPHD